MIGLEVGVGEHLAGVGEHFVNVGDPFVGVGEHLVPEISPSLVIMGPTCYYREPSHQYSRRYAHPKP